jgi:hypothetical protein
MSDVSGGIDFRIKKFRSKAHQKMDTILTLKPVYSSTLPSKPAFPFQFFFPSGSLPYPQKTWQDDDWHGSTLHPDRRLYFLWVALPRAVCAQVEP